ncbi:uncharacterized protein LOC111691851 [Anoplophora glabripennis]|uniref:uncharacterized protein LOC111691851 n=1 Tax=Anoplophora glabripennis TaxID=217634 RepID=UPI000C778573|nr:uncharacterized protein LOC111691851 [Anoplophora glabripennis]
MATENVGHLREFDPLNCDWTIYKRRLENYFIANNITDKTWMRAIVLNLLSEDAYQLVHSLSLPAESETKSYDELIKLISEHFKPTTSVFASRYKFYSARKAVNESPKEWAAKLRNLALHCDFSQDQLEMVLRDQFIIAYDKGSVQDRLMEEKKSVTFQQVIELAASKSAPLSFAHNVKREPEVLHIRNSQGAKKKTQIYRGGGSSTLMVQDQRQSGRPNCSRGDVLQQERFQRGANSARTSQSPKCKVCGRRNHLEAQCSFRECFCHICNVKGHLANMCKHKTGKNSKTNNLVSYIKPIDHENEMEPEPEARPLPFAIKEKVEIELRRLEQIGVIEPVSYSPWGTPIVPVLKKDGSVRICGDFKITLNPYIEIDQYPLPRIEELFGKLQGGVEFSKLDLSTAYQQISLDETSKNLESSLPSTLAGPDIPERLSIVDLTNSPEGSRPKRNVKPVERLIYT